MHIFKNTNFDFLRWRWHAVALSWVVIIAGLVAIVDERHSARHRVRRRHRRSIAQFDQRRRSSGARRAQPALPGGGQNAIVQSYGDPAQRQVMVRVPQVGAEAGASLSDDADKVDAGARRRPTSANFTIVGTEIVGPAVGRS